MTIATKYNPQIAWRTLTKDVFQLTKETDTEPATYRMTVKAIDTNNPGAGEKEIGYCVVDYLGSIFPIIGVDTTTVDIQDIFRTGGCPTCGQMAIIYQSVYNGRSQYLMQDNFRFLHPLALANYLKYAVALLWANDPNAKKVPFATAVKPTIENYQTDQVDPEDITKIINYAELYGENPIIRLFIINDESSSFEYRQISPVFTYVDGLIDTISFEYGDPNVACFIIISK